MSLAPLILLSGTTASGKSSLAVRIAERIGGVVINADSMQIYREAAILTNRPTFDATRRVPHFLYGAASARDWWSAARWRDAAVRTLESVGSAVIVGGTGLYFEVLERGLSRVPLIPEDVRSLVRGRAARSSSWSLHRDLARVDPDTAREISPSDRQRTVRALEVFSAFGEGLSSFRRRDPRTSLSLSGVSSHRISARWFLSPPREVLRDRISARFGEMLRLGAVSEARRLSEMNLPSECPLLKAHGVPELIAFSEGRMTLSEAEARAVSNTRRYAKRQRTWFSGRMKGWREISDPCVVDEASMDAASSMG